MLSDDIETVRLLICKSDPSQVQLDAFQRIKVFVEAQNTAYNTSIDAILRDLESFCNGRITLGINASAYNDVLCLVRQHINSAKQHNR